MAFHCVTNPPTTATTVEPAAWRLQALASIALAAVGLAGVGAGQAWAMPLLLAPVLEELVFRTGLHESLLRLSIARGLPNHSVWPTVLTALAFAAAHVLVRPSLHSALTCAPALVIGHVYQRQRSLLHCVALHALFNTVWWLCADRLG
jgi:membrane protease YdiL (CAAX protease family)